MHNRIISSGVVTLLELSGMLKSDNGRYWRNVYFFFIVSFYITSNIKCIRFTLDTYYQCVKVCFIACFAIPHLLLGSLYIKHVYIHTRSMP